MNQLVEKRKFRRFEITGGEARYKKIGLHAFLKDFSNPYPLLNISIGGLSILYEEEFGQGEEAMIQLVAPNEAPLNLRSRMIWQGPLVLSTDLVIAFEFLPFDDNKGCNPPGTLNVLRRLYARYAKYGK
ncbi:PilZ domain-containing protein [Thermodesulfobacteriota bacterium]